MDLLQVWRHGQCNVRIIPLSFRDVSLVLFEVVEVLHCLASVCIAFDAMVGDEVDGGHGMLGERMC